MKLNCANIYIYIERERERERELQLICWCKMQINELLLLFLNGSMN